MGTKWPVNVGLRSERNSVVKASRVMKTSRIKFDAIAQTARYGLSVNYAESDVIKPPLMVDDAPLELNPHLVVAAGLLWGESTISRVEYEGTLSAKVAGQWESNLGIALEGSVSKNEYERAANSDLFVSSGGLISETTPGRDETVLKVVPSARFYGALKGIKESIIASNAWMFEESALAQLCLGILFADEFMARSIYVEEKLRDKDIERALAILEPLSIDVDCAGRGKLDA